MYIVFVIENVYTKEFEPYGYEGTLDDLPEMVEEADELKVAFLSKRGYTFCIKETFYGYARQN